MAMVIKRFEVYLVNLDPTIGHEIQKTQPCVIISPDEMNQSLSTVMVAPLTTKGRSYPTRVPLVFQQKSGQIILDQLHIVDKLRLVKLLGQVSLSSQQKICTILQELFAL